MILVDGNRAFDGLRRDHRALVDIAEHLIRHLSSLKDRLVRDGTHYGHHDALAARPASLATYLQGALLTAAHALYPAAFVQLRAAFEHHAVDRLLFLADRYEQLLKIDEEQFEEWQGDRENWPEGVRDIRRNSRNEKVIEWDAPKVTNSEGSESGLEFSPYYMFMQEYDPFPADIKAAYGDQEVEASIRSHIKTQKLLWRRLFTWSNIRHNLVLNYLVSERDATRLDFHYKFLSAFAHPVSLDAGSGVPEHEHCASELVLLYVCYLAIEELKMFAGATGRRPAVGIQGWDEVEDLMLEAERCVRHGWFPGRSPTLYDRFVEYESRFWEADNEDDSPATQPNGPESIPDAEVRYYAHPLERLVEYHNQVSDDGELMLLRTRLGGSEAKTCPLRIPSL